MKKAMGKTIVGTLGIPVLQTIISKIPMDKFSLSKIKFKCVHQIEGRRRYKSELLKNKEFATALKQKISSFQLLKKLTINPVTGSMLLEYTCPEEKIDEMMKSLNEQSKKLSESKKVEGNKGQRKIGKAAVSVGTAYAGAKGAAAIGKGIGRGMRGQGLTNMFPSLLSSLNINGISGIVATLCLAWGGYSLFKKNQIPVGPQLIWFGYKAIEGITKKE